MAMMVIVRSVAGLPPKEAQPHMLMIDGDVDDGDDDDDDDDNGDIENEGVDDDDVHEIDEDEREERRIPFSMEPLIAWRPTPQGHKAHPRAHSA